jgi:hypothetical protein
MKLTEANWQTVILKAARQYARQATHLKLVTRADRNTMQVVMLQRCPGGEPLCGGLKANYWRSVRERCWPKEFADYYLLGRSLTEALDRPLVTLCGMTEGIEYGCSLGRDSTVAFAKTIRGVLLEEAFLTGLSIAYSKDGLPLET